MRTLSLYIHVPFCTRRCSYCSFYHVPAAEARQRAFVDVLVDEIGAGLDAIGEAVALRTIFVGGGTPTVLEPSHWRRLVGAIAPHLAPAGAPEFTVEMNPEDVTEELVAFLRALGVNRASLGIQSMHAVGQKVLKRCPPEVNAGAIEIVRRSFGNVSFDVLLGVPRTTVADLRATVKTLLEFDPAHLSVYGLEAGGDMSHEVERFFRAVDPDRVADEYLWVCEALRERGYGHYEVSNFARPGFESAHNRVYWDGGDYLGVGPAAHSSIGGRRFWNAPSLEAYLEWRPGGHLAARQYDGEGDRRVERAMLLLRTDRGLPRSECACADAVVDSFVADALVVESQGRVFATDRGYLLLNDLVLRLTTPPARWRGGRATTQTSVPAC
jgi:oxygen-independent coproporphyrinogen-3 oxidase